jgi:hypothetical protein
MFEYISETTTTQYGSVLADPVRIGTAFQKGFDTVSSFLVEDTPGFEKSAESADNLITKTVGLIDQLSAMINRSGYFKEPFRTQIDEITHYHYCYSIDGINKKVLSELEFQKRNIQKFKLGQVDYYTYWYNNCLSHYKKMVDVASVSCSPISLSWKDAQEMAIIESGQLDRDYINGMHQNIVLQSITGLPRINHEQQELLDDTGFISKLADLINKGFVIFQVPVEPTIEPAKPRSFFSFFGKR